MAWNRLLLTLASSSLVLTAFSQDPPPRPERDDRRPHERPDGDRRRDPRFREMRERFERMTEEERRHAMEKFRHWQKMPGDERAHFRFMREEREKRTREGVDAALGGSRLQLDQAQREKFTEIYKRERKQLEEELRAEMDQRRQERLPELHKKVIEAYQKEPATPTPSPEPSASPEPASAEVSPAPTETPAAP